MTLKRFKVVGLHGHATIESVFEDRTTIIVGPNGTGKSTLLNILYYSLTAQWERLRALPFESIELEGDDTSLALTKAQVQELSLGKRADRDSIYVRRLVSSNHLERFTSEAPFSEQERSYYASLLNIPIHDVESFKRYFVSKHSDAFVLNLAKDVTSALRTLCPHYIVYLPTYRRIEQDLRQISPKVLEEMERYGRRELNFGRKTDRYVELIQFGMADVEERIKDHLEGIRKFAWGLLGKLTSAYLRDIMVASRGRADTAYLKSLSDEQIRSVLYRVEEASLSPDDKEKIARQIIEISRTSDAKLSNPKRNIVDYFSRLAKAHEEISEQERAIRNFTDRVNEYFQPRKRFEFDTRDYSFGFKTIRGDRIPLSALSSGEKQLVSILSYIYLEGDKTFAVIIDEPELSLSVPWQRRFLVDLLASGRVASLFAVTHSPFIYANELEASAVDIESFVQADDGVFEDAIVDPDDDEGGVVLP